MFVLVCIISVSFVHVLFSFLFICSLSHFKLPVLSILVQLVISFLTMHFCVHMKQVVKEDEEPVEFLALLSSL